ncbi:MAG: pilus assembly protein PilP [Magnetococcales bacterium]|nr:pilus assembly protein PilP [Magnetococcales bacterium]
MKRLALALLIAGTPLSPWAEEAQKEEPYTYRSVGKRDPFQPPAAVEKQLAAAMAAAKDLPVAPQRVKEPLEAFQLDSLKLVAILFSAEKEEPAAMVQDPTGKGHLIRKKNFIGSREGQIMEIQDGVVIIHEPPQTTNGDRKIITLRLHEEKAK